MSKKPAKNLRKPSQVERAAGSLPAQGAAAVVASVGGPFVAAALAQATGAVSPELIVMAGAGVAAQLPALLAALLAGRYVPRVQAQFDELQAQLLEDRDRLDAASDSQVDIIRAVAIAIMTGANAAKFEHLKRAAHNAPRMEDLPPELTPHIGRVLRDMSASEAAFIARNFGYRWIMVTATGKEQNDTMLVRPGSDDDATVSGLVNLGVLISAGDVIDSLGKFRFTPVAGKLLVLFEVTHHSRK